MLQTPFDDKQPTSYFRACTVTRVATALMNLHTQWACRLSRLSRPLKFELPSFELNSRSQEKELFLFLSSFIGISQIKFHNSLKNV